MARKIIAVILIALIFGGIFLIGNKKSLHCDGCDKIIRVSKKSAMEEDWMIFCEECNSAMTGGLPEEEN
ncbi:MAG: hypothetical protein E7660_01085 [Ruminococcaceae bacterium]|nr:hypothetical protein [Oscillospiraceae bacterium]